MSKPSVSRFGRAITRNAVVARLGRPDRTEGSVNDPREHNERGVHFNEKWIYDHLCNDPSGASMRTVFWHRYDFTGTMVRKTNEQEWSDDERLAQALVTIPSRLAPIADKHRPFDRNGRYSPASELRDAQDLGGYIQVSMPPSIFVNAPTGHQPIFEVYRAMQSRLDGYRQSAAAIFLGFAAAALALDSAFFRTVVDPAVLYPNPPNHRFGYIAIGVGILLTIVCIYGSVIIRNVGLYFAEMTSIVYKIDQANRVWEPDAWFTGEALYPYNFLSTTRVGRVPEDNNLIGWHDPMIRRLSKAIFLFAIFHFLLYGLVAYVSWHVVSLPQ